MTIEDVDQRIATLEELQRTEPVPRLRADMGTALSWLRQYRQALTGDGPETIEDVIARRQHQPLWMREAETFRTLLEAGAIAQNDERVTLRWDLIAEGQRDVAVSWANEIVALYRGRTAGGRPKKNST